MSFKRLYLCYYYYRLQAQAAQEIPQDPPLGIEAPPPISKYISSQKYNSWGAFRSDRAF